MNFLAGFDDWMEQREPGWKAEEARKRAERERVRLERCERLIEEFGSEDAVFRERPEEKLLREALDPLADRAKYINSDDTYISGYDGWRSGRLPVRVWNAVNDGIRLPGDVCSVWTEYMEWERLVDARCAFLPDYDAEIWIHARRAALEHLLDVLPARSDDDFAARLEWLQYLAEREFYRGVEQDGALAARMRADHQFLRRLAV